jgi:hypothetical protein
LSRHALRWPLTRASSLHYGSVRLSTGARVAGLFVKQAHGDDMASRPRLDLCPSDGVVGDVNPARRSPRQICIGIGRSLEQAGVSAVKSRANIVISGQDAYRVGAGAVVASGDVILRITMACEPCAYGARLSGVPMRRFREIDRYLAIVLQAGQMYYDDPVAIQPHVFDASPDDFRTRCCWALDKIPRGRLVTNVDFLTAIGASRSYLRALPRWLHSAAALGKPVHRVLTSQLSTPSWAPDALSTLKREGADLSSLSDSVISFTETLWFQTSIDDALATIWDRVEHGMHVASDGKLSIASRSLH